MPKLVYMFPESHAPMWFAQRFQGHDIGFYDEQCQYPTDTVFLHDLYGDHSYLMKQHLALGHRIIFDAKNEHYLPSPLRTMIADFQARPGQTAIIISGQTAKPIHGITVFNTPYWYWIIDQISWRDFELDRWQPEPNPKYKFLCQLNRATHDRDYLMERLRATNQLSQGLVSYRSRGRFLPDDVDPATFSGNWQRWVNKSWIDSTYFTVAAETYIDDVYPHGISLSLDPNLFFSEKTYKVLACQQPLLLVSTLHNLAYLRFQGFETFPEIFDERYDDQTCYKERIRIVTENLIKFDPTCLQQPIVKEKIRHNHARFFDRTLTDRYAQETIVEPILNWIYG